MRYTHETSSLSTSLRDEESPDLFIRGLSNCLRKVDVAFQPELRRWPPQAIKCSLKDIVPADQVTHNTM